MDNPLLLSYNANPAAPIVWRRWKWIGLIVFGAALLFGKWLPTPVTVIGKVYGAVVILNLAFQGFRWLKNRLFWRVRNRIAGSLIFVGLIPIVLIAASICAALYLLAGQLASRIVEQTLGRYPEEIASIHAILAQRADPSSPERLSGDLPPLLQPWKEAFPRAAIRVAKRNEDGTFAVVWRHDPSGFLPGTGEYPAEKWLRPDGTYTGMLRWGRLVFLAVSRPLLRFPGYWLDVSVPLDAHIAKRIFRDRSIYVGFAGAGTTRVTVSREQVHVEVDSPGVEAEAEREFRTMLDGLEKQRIGDPRRQVTWASVLSCPDFLSGKNDSAGVAIFHAPLEPLYQAYIGGAFDQGKVVLILLFILFGLFAAAELTSLVVGIAISRRVTKSVDDMYRGILALQGGDLDYKIPVRKSDQLGLLAHSFNQMTGSITRLLEEVSEKKRLEQELEIAREVQATLFPKQLPRPRGLEIFGGCEPARVVSGDYYDFIVEDEARLHIVVGDISGKGISAALLMANLQAAMRNQLLKLRHGTPDRLEESLAGLMAGLNGQIFANSPSGKYATLFVGNYDAENRTLCYCNAGHLPPIVLHNGKLSRLETGGTVLGLFETAHYLAGSVILEPGTLIAMYTDGVTEAPNDADEEFGEERLIEILRETRNRSPEEIYRAVSERLMSWQGALKQHDDITLIIAKIS